MRGDEVLASSNESQPAMNVRASWFPRLGPGDGSVWIQYSSSTVMFRNVQRPLEACTLPGLLAEMARTIAIYYYVVVESAAATMEHMRRTYSLAGRRVNEWHLMLMYK